MWEVKRMYVTSNILLTTANDAGGGAAYLATRSGKKRRCTVAVPQVPTMGVLVARSDIGPDPTSQITSSIAAVLPGSMRASSLTTTQK
jgi:hypothetical protein